MNISDDNRQGAAWIDGKITPIADAKISLLDWGFLHSDATYDVAHVWKNRFFRVGEHIDRFFRGMERLHMNIGMTQAQVKQIMFDCVAATGLENAYVEIICTRGQPAPGSRDPRTCRNQFWAFAIPFVWVLPPGQKGLSVIVSDRQRIPEASVDPSIKNYHWLDLVQGLFEAYDRDADSVVLTDERGHLCEGPGFNVFLVKEKTLFTPRRGVLQGITRRTVMELADKHQLQTTPCEVTLVMAEDADELFVTSTAGGIMPVVELNGRLIGLGECGPITQQLIEAYWDLHKDPQYSEALV